jgi:Zn-dependent protease
MFLDLKKERTLKANHVSLIHSVTLIAFGSWAYFGSESPSITALIPVIFGVLLLALNKGVQKENKVLAHVAVLFTLLILFGLLKPFSSQLSQGDAVGIFRVGAMLATTLWALVAFVQSFIAARKRRAATSS